jgi:hypothetical protein
MAVANDASHSGACRLGGRSGGGLREQKVTGSDRPGPTLQAFSEWGTIHSGTAPFQ